MTRVRSFLAVVAMLGAAGPAWADYGAIALSPETAHWGWATGYDSQWQAEDAALAECNRRSAVGCILGPWFRDACGALAVTPGNRDVGWGSDWGVTPAEAEASALRLCRNHNGSNCNIVVSVCSN